MTQDLQQLNRSETTHMPNREVENRKEDKIQRARI